MRFTFFCLYILVATSSLQGQDTLIDDPISAYMYPGKIHTMLAAFAGEWTVEMKSSMGQGGLTDVVQLQAQSEIILDGRFLQIILTGAMSGAAFEEHILIGYDNIRGVFQMIEYSNLRTTLFHNTGGWDPLTRVATVYGTATHPVLDKPINTRKVIHFSDPEKLILEYYDTVEGKKEQKTAETILVRKK